MSKNQDDTNNTGQNPVTICAKNIAEARELFSKHSETYIQWKGTDICMDFHCACGYHNHYDGYFAYEIVCKSCRSVYALSEHIQVIKIEKTEGQPLESEV